MVTIHAPTSVPDAARPQATPVKIHALGMLVDVCQIRLDNTTPDSWRWRRLMLQRRALLALAGCPKLDERGQRV